VTTSNLTDRGLARGSADPGQTATRGLRDGNDCYRIYVSMAPEEQLIAHV